MRLHSAGSDVFQNGRSKTPMIVSWFLGWITTIEGHMSIALVENSSLRILKLFGFLLAYAIVHFDNLPHFTRLQRRR